MLDRRTIVAGLAAAPLLAATRLRAQPTLNPLQALIIGNDKYKAIRPLERAVADADAIAKKIAAFGYEITPAMEADTDAMFAAFQAFRARLTPDSAAFVYFAGHGLQVNGTNYLIPVDADGSSDERMLETSLPLGTLLDDIHRTGPRQAIVMLDACRNQPLKLEMSGAAAGFASVQVPGGFYVAYSAGSGQLALDKLDDKDRDPNGVFTRFLLRNLAPDKPIDAIMYETKCQVAAAADTVGHPQNPAVYNQSRGELRLDGRQDPAALRAIFCTAGTGRLHQTAVLLIGCQRYGGRTQLADLMTPVADARQLEQSFKALGAETMILADPGREAIRAACRKLAEGGFERIVVHFAGMGELIDNEAAMLVADPAAPPLRLQQRGGKVGASASAIGPAMEGVECIFLSDLVDDLRIRSAPGAKTTRAIGGAWSRPGAKLVFLLDFCLGPLDLGIEASKGHVLQALQRGHDDLYAHVAVITAGGLFQTVLDVAEGQRNSPFTIAVDNALARPGLSLVQLAAVIRDEVEGLTKGLQSPTLFAYPQRRNDPFVEKIKPKPDARNEIRRDTGTGRPAGKARPTTHTCSASTARN